MKISAKYSPNFGLRLAGLAWTCLLMASCSSTKPPPSQPLALTKAEHHSRLAQQQAEQENWPASLAQWQAAADQYRLLNRLPELATALHNAGQACKHLNQYAQAEEQLERAAQLNTLLGRREHWWRNQIALLQVEALAEADRGSHFEQLLPLSSELTNPELAGQFLNELGLWQEKNQADLSAETFRNAQEQFRRANNHQGLGTALANRARLQERAGNHQTAADLWRQALEEFERVGDPIGITHALAGRGRSLAANKTDLETAKELLRRAAENFKTLGAHEAHTNTLRVLEELH